MEKGCGIQQYQGLVLSIRCVSKRLCTDIIINRPKQPTVRICETGYIKMVYI